MTGSERTDDADRDGDGRPADGTQLWPGDPGALEADVRSTLVALIKGPYLSQASTPNLWSSLLANLAVVRSRLADLYLELALDTEREIAFARNVRLEEGRVPQMMRKLPLSFIDTAVLLHLRHLLLRAASHGERAYVGGGEIVDHLQQLRPAADHDAAGWAKRVRASVNRMRKDYKLLEATDTEDRFEILAILGLLISPDVVAGLEAEYRAAADGGAGAPAGADQGDTGAQSGGVALVPGEDGGTDDGAGDGAEEARADD